MIRRFLKYLPAGVAVSPELKMGEKRRTIQIVTEKTVHILECWRRIVAAGGERAYLDFMHWEDGEPAFFIEGFEWREASGVYCFGSWSPLGERLAKRGKISGVSSAVCWRGMTLQRAREWIPNVTLAAPSSPQPPSASAVTPPAIVVEAFLPLVPWADMGCVAIAPIEPAFVECRINALITHA